ncbi:MAG: Dabb family protein [Chitinophagaceae bacterium]
MDRKTFIQQSAMGALGVLVAPKNDHSMQKNLFVHHVYFWLKEPQSKEAAAKLVEGLEGLSKVKTIQMFHIGKPADTNREVIERSYAISWLVLFKDKADQDSYQIDPIHLKFVEQYSYLWSKVVVYDSVDVK